MIDVSEILNGMDEIRQFWDPFMSKDCFFRTVRPLLDPILFERPYIGRRKERVMKFYTYKHLLLSLKLRLKKNEKNEVL